MTTYETITVAALLIGPVLAVLVQLAAEKRKHTRDQRTATFRMMESVRHLPGDPAYSTAVNMIPVDFNRVPKVMAAHKAYIEAITYQASPENAETHMTQVVSKQTKLIFEMARNLGYDLPETDIQTSAYAASGFIARDNLMLEAWGAWPRIAAALEAQKATPPENPQAEAR